MDNNPQPAIEPITPADPQPEPAPPAPPYTPGEEPEGPAPIIPAPISPEVPTVTEEPRAGAFAQDQSQSSFAGGGKDDPDAIAEERPGL